MFLLFKPAASKEDKETNENEAIPLLMRNALPDVEGFEKNEKLDIAMRPEQVSERNLGCFCFLFHFACTSYHLVTWASCGSQGIK